MDKATVRPFVALVFVQFCFASLAVVGKIALQSFPPLIVAGMRLFFASLFLAVIALYVKRERLPRRDAIQLFGLSMLGVVFNQLLFLEGLSRTTAVNASILIATIPVFTMLVAIMVGQEGPRIVRISGIVLSMSGALVLVSIEGFQLQSQYTVGNILVVLNAFSYSLYLVFSRSLLKRYRSTTIVAWTFLYGAMVVTPLAAWRATSFDLEGVPQVAWFAMLWIILVPSVLAYSLNTFALKRIRSSTVATYIFLQPVFGIALALVFLPGETVGLRTAIGGILVLLGVVLVSRTESIEPMVAVPQSGEAISRQPIAEPDGRPQSEPQEDHQPR